MTSRSAVPPAGAIVHQTTPRLPSYTTTRCLRSTSFTRRCRIYPVRPQITDGPPTKAGALYFSVLHLEPWPGRGRGGGGARGATVPDQDGLTRAPNNAFDHINLASSTAMLRPTPKLLCGACKSTSTATCFISDTERAFCGFLIVMHERYISAA